MGSLMRRDAIRWGEKEILIFLIHLTDIQYSPEDVGNKSEEFVGSSKDLE